MNKLKRLIDRACHKQTALHDSIFLDAMLPEFKAANAELLKAIKMNDKSGAIPYTELLEINKAMKANDAEKAGQALKKVQAKLNKAEKALDEEIKTATEKLAESKNSRETALQALKAKKAVAQIFEKAKAACDSAKQSPKNASKLTALIDKIKEYGDLSKRTSQIVTMSASGKDITKQLDMLKKSIEASEKKYKKDLSIIEQAAKHSKDELEKIADGQKIVQGKRDAFQKERMYLANVIKQMPSGDIRQERGKGVMQKNIERKGTDQSDTNSNRQVVNEKTEHKRTTASFVSGKSGKIGYGAYLSKEGNEITVEIKPGFPLPYILNKGIWMEIPTIGVDAYVPEGDPRFKSNGGRSYLVWGKYQKSLS